MGRSVGEQAVAGMVTRLAALPGIRLPAQLTRRGQPSLETIRGYMRSLLERDPGVFLERYGEILSEGELQQFHPLRDDYEVDFYLKALEDRRDAKRQQTVARNRRLAYMYRWGRGVSASGLRHPPLPVRPHAYTARAFSHYRLMAEGSYFSEAAMERRQPWLFHDMVGQYRAPVPEQPLEELSTVAYAERVLEREDAAQLREARLKQQAAFDAVEEETESDDDDDGVPTREPLQEASGSTTTEGPLDDDPAVR